MLHEMRLNHQPFLSIKSGDKKIEMRLFDEKRQIIQIGDTIEFLDRDTNEILSAKVIALHRFKNFEQLYSAFDKALLGYTEYETANPEDMKKYYSKNDIEKYGVVGIKIELL